MLSWSVAGLALLLALMAHLSVRRLARKLDALNQSYWELRYDYTRLRSQLSRLDPDSARRASEGPDGDPAAGASGPGAQGPSVAFVPLATIRRKDKQNPA